MNQEFRIEIPQFDPRWSRSLVPLVAIVVACLALHTTTVAGELSPDRLVIMGLRTRQ